MPSSDSLPAITSRSKLGGRQRRTALGGCFAESAAGGTAPRRGSGRAGLSSSEELSGTGSAAAGSFSWIVPEISWRDDDRTARIRGTIPFNGGNVRVSGSSHRALELDQSTERELSVMRSLTSFLFPATNRAHRRRSYLVRLRVEPLEQRRLLSAVPFSPQQVPPPPTGPSG